MTFETPFVLRPHDRCQVQIQTIGREKASVIIIDNFLQDAERLVEIAAAIPQHFRPKPSSFYPGVVAPSPPPYPQASFSFIEALARKQFRLLDNPLVGIQSSFALSTMPAQDAQIIQKIPHVDSTSNSTFFLLHYLFDGADWGTSFYRHRRSKYEIITDQRMPAYSEHLRRELADTTPDRYIRGSTPQFEEIAKFEAVFNRAMIYRSNSLHSANLGPDMPFGNTPRTGRLTMNTIIALAESPPKRHAGHPGKPTRRS